MTNKKICYPLDRAVGLKIGCGLLTVDASPQNGRPQLKIIQLYPRGWEPSLEPHCRLRAIKYLRKWVCSRRRRYCTVLGLEQPIKRRYATKRGVCVLRRVAPALLYTRQHRTRARDWWT